MCRSVSPPHPRAQALANEFFGRKNSRLGRPILQQLVQRQPEAAWRALAPRLLHFASAAAGPGPAKPKREKQKKGKKGEKGRQGEAEEEAPSAAEAALAAAAGPPPPPRTAFQRVVAIQLLTALLRPTANIGDAAVARRRLARHGDGLAGAFSSALRASAAKEAGALVKTQRLKELLKFGKALAAAGRRAGGVGGGGAASAMLNALDEAAASEHTNRLAALPSTRKGVLQWL